MKPRSLPRFRSSYPYICSACQLSHTLRRQFSNLPAKFANPLHPPPAGFSLLPSRRLISLSGPDSTHYLQGVITANLSPSTPRNGGFYTAFLNAQGRLLNDVFIYPDFTKGEGGWLIEVDAKEVEILAKHIKRYKLRAKFEVRVLEEQERGVWSVWDEGGDGWQRHGLEGASSALSKEGEIGCTDSRAPGMGRRVLLPAEKKPEVDAAEVDEGAYRVRRYLKGVPEGQDELLRESALPQESNIDFMGGIDYRKGCYVGQELTIRTHHTGVVRKRVLPVMLYRKDESMPSALEYNPTIELGAESIPREASIGRFEKRGRSAGKWLAGVGNIGLGLCRLEVMTDVQVQGEAGGYKEGDEFKLEWETDDGNNEILKMKAFVPSWHLTKQ